MRIDGKMRNSSIPAMVQMLDYSEFTQKIARNVVALINICSTNISFYAAFSNGEYDGHMGIMVGKAGPVIGRRQLTLTGQTTIQSICTHAAGDNRIAFHCIID